MGLRADSTSPARFLYNNYQQALKIIAENQHLLDKCKAEYGLTDETIEEYINDELIDQRPNPIGTVPIVHIPNLPVSGSPWGLSDAHDIITINRQYNEIATDVADIINYHAAPVTVIRR